MLCWNDGERVLGLLASLDGIDPRPDLVVVVDNGSQDGSAERIETAFPQHRLVRLGANLGYAAAVNRGIAIATAEGCDWLWLLNSDVELPHAVLGSLLSAAERDPRCGLASCMLTDRGGNMLAAGGGRLNLWTGMLRHSGSPQDRCDYLSGACLLVRERLVAAIGSFDERHFFYWEDVEFSLRARAAGWTLAVARDCRVVHDEGSTLGRWSEERWHRLFLETFRFLFRNAPLPRTAALLRLAHHTVTMLAHGRVAAVRGAWRAAAEALGEAILPRRRASRRGLTA